MGQNSNHQTVFPESCLPDDTAGKVIGLVNSLPTHAAVRVTILIVYVARNVQKFMAFRSDRVVFLFCYLSDDARIVDYSAWKESTPQHVLFTCKRHD